MAVSIGGAGAVFQTSGAVFALGSFAVAVSTSLTRDTLSTNGVANLVVAAIAVLRASGAVLARLAGAVSAGILVPTGCSFYIAYSWRTSAVLRATDTIFIKVAVVVTTDCVAGAVAGRPLASIVSAVFQFFSRCAATVEPK